MKHFFIGFCFLGAVIFSGCRSVDSTDSIPAVSPFVVDRYLGTWHEIARMPHSFERGLVEVTACYSLRPDGRINVVNTGFRDGKKHSIQGVAKFKDLTDIGELRVCFFWPFYGDYKIIYLEPDYSAAIVTSSSMDYLWLLSRTPELPPERLKDYVQKIRDWGFPAEKLEYPAAHR